MGRGCAPTGPLPPVGGAGGLAGPRPFGAGGGIGVPLPYTAAVCC